jgi:acyl carrier protein
VEEPEATAAFVERLVLEYAQSVPKGRPLHAGLSLRDDLAIESLSLVSLTLRLGDELGIDITEAGVELDLGEVKTLGDLVRVAQTLSDHLALNPERRT